MHTNKIMTAVAGVGNTRANHDFYATDPKAVVPIITELNLLHSQPSFTIWEPACGNGAISKTLPQHHKIISTDLENHGYGLSGMDFTLEQTLVSIGDVDIVLTNPPYKLSEQFLVSALKATKNRKGKVAFLNKLNWLSGVKRKKLFETTPLSRVLIFSKEPCFYKNGTDYVDSHLIEFAWFIWDWTIYDIKLYPNVPKPTLGWI